MLPIPTHELEPVVVTLRAKLVWAVSSAIAKPKTAPTPTPGPVTLPSATVAVFVPPDGLSPRERAQAVVEGGLLGTYRSHSTRRPSLRAGVISVSMWW